MWGEVLRTVTVNINDDKHFKKITRQGTDMDQTWFTSHICDVSLPQDTTGYVCMSISIQPIYFYIVKTKKLIQL